MYYSDSPKQCNLHWNLFLRIPVSSLMRLFSKTHLSWWPFTFDLCWPLYDQTWWTTNIILILLKWPEDKVYLKRLMLWKNMVNTRCSLFFRLSPQEWESAHPCESDPDELENGLNLLNCLWHNIGALMQQGSDLAPK